MFQADVLLSKCKVDNSILFMQTLKPLHTYIQYVCTCKYKIVAYLEWNTTLI